MIMNRCQKCREILKPNREVWLELNTKTFTYTDSGVPESLSQGWFSFGADCARKARLQHFKVLHESLPHPCGSGSAHEAGR